MFDRVGVIEFDAKVTSPDAMLEAAIEAGADDVVSSEAGHEVYAAQDSFANVAKALEAKFGDPRKAALVWKPQNTVAIDDERGEKMFKLMELLNEHEIIEVAGPVPATSIILAPCFNIRIGVGSVDWFRYPLPPNRTCGSPASGSPVGGLTCERTDGPRHGVSCKLRGSGLVGSVGIRVVQPRGSSRSHVEPSPAVLALKAMLSVSFRMDQTSRLHLPAPLRSPGITRLHRYYECSDSCAVGANPWPVLLLAEGGTSDSILPLAPRRSPRFTCSVPPEPSVSNHPAASHDRFNT
jgi:hypothetical protein